LRGSAPAACAICTSILCKLLCRVVLLLSILVRITATGELPQWEAKAWDALKVDGFVPGDPINRNRQITTKYAEMFNTDKKPNELNPFEWFGMAAFASRLA